MSDNRGGGPTFSLSGAAIILALLGALVVQELPLRGSRPAQPVASGYDIPGREDVPARLWQDPFAAVQNYLPTLGDGSDTESGKRQSKDFAAVCAALYPRDSEVSPDDRRDGGTRDHGLIPARWYHSEQELACQIADAREPVTVLGVMVFGGPYVEDAEHRTRRRYAVVSALESAGFTPSDADHISFIYDPVLMDRKGAVTDRGRIRRFVPYEWYEPREGKTGNPLLLLWLNDDGYGADPLRRLGRLVDSIFLPGVQPPDSVKIIGPAGSNTLQTMVDELACQGPPTHGRHAPGLPLYLEIYSPSATAADSILLGKSNVTNDARSESVSGFFADYGITLRRTIPDDLKLSEVLVRELDRRGVAARARSGKGKHIVLISEWDTIYGRALPDAFRKAVLDACLLSEAGGGPDCSAAPSWLHRYSYLRGLDGMTSGARSDSGKDESDDSRSSASREPPGVSRSPDRAQGQKQVDYLRRLAYSIRDLDRELEAGGEGRVGAIGVLGSDVYDKLLILQAVRPLFSDVVFFTTDLDASLLHPADYHFTRNLIVASGYGLTLNSGLQGQIPPFRDGYQASVFLSVLAALSTETPEQSQLDRWMSPRIFEIGRNGAFDLSPRTENPEMKVTLPGLPVRDKVLLHPPGPDFFPRSGTLILVFLLVAIGTLLLAAVSDDFRQFLSSAWRYSRNNRRVAIPVALLGVIVPVIALIAIDLAGRDGEPFSLTDGISIWPTEILRSIAAILSLYFLARCWREIKKSNRDIRDEFGLDPAAPQLEPPSGLLERCLRFSVFSWRRQGRGDNCKQGSAPGGEGQSLAVPATSSEKACQWLDIRKIWADNQFLGTFGRRLSRSVIRVGIYAVLGMILMNLFGFPFRPYRGEVAFWIDLAVLFMSVLSMMVLIFFVVDATRLCRVFMEKLVDGRVAWPRGTVQSCCGQFGVRPAFAMEVLNIKLIASRTDTISRLIYYPFLVLFLMIVSRITYFDDWDLPLGLAIIFLLNAMYLVYCSIVMRRTAVAARDAAIDRLEKEQMKVTKMGGRESPVTDQVNLIIKYLRDIHSGAFVPIHQQPMVRSLLLPFGALGLSVIDYLSLAS